MGTNPLVFGLPTDDAFPFVLDCATSVNQRGKISIDRSRARHPPLGRRRVRPLRVVCLRGDDLSLTTAYDVVVWCHGPSGKIEKYAREGLPTPAGAVISTAGETLTDSKDILDALVARRSSSSRAAVIEWDESRLSTTRRVTGGLLAARSSRAAAPRSRRSAARATRWRATR